MLKNLFVKTPNLEQIRKIVFKALWNSENMKNIANDLKFTGKDKIQGHEYYQIWKSEEQNQLYIAYCGDIRNPVKILWKGLS